jgi:hypothetical protein
MKKRKRRKLEAAGWAVGSAQEFLSLSDADAALIEMKLSLDQSEGTKTTRGRISKVAKCGLKARAQRKKDSSR